MKKLIFLVASLFAITSYGQDKFNFVNFNKLIEVHGTEYVIASVEKRGKLKGIKNQYLLFINTETGKSNKVDFPKGAYIKEIKQIKIDSFDIHQIILLGRTVDLNNKKGIEWTEPNQIIILSTDGKEQTQLTDSNLFVSSWVVNRKTGTITITGHYDSNENGKYDYTDKNEIGIYDLKSLKLIRKI